MRLHRRDAMLRLGQIGAGAVTLPGLLSLEAAAQSGTGHHMVASGGRAKSCILIYLWGGPPQMDLWDPNPESAQGIRSLYSPIATSVPGLVVSEKIPRFAKLAHKTAVIRSLTHDSNEHEPSVYRTLTGDVNPSLRVPKNARNRNDAPSLGSVVSAFTPMGSLPATVTIPRPIGHEGVTYSGTYAGFLGARHDPMEIAPAGESSHGATHSLSLADELTNTRLLARQGLLRSLENLDRRFDTASFGMNDFRQQAYSMLTSPKAKQAFDVSQIDDETRNRYGRNEWGESILLARKLVESGVRLVTISWMYIQKSGNVANVWDNHGPFEGKTGYQMLEQEYCIPSLEQGYSALIEDLSDSGLLDETLVAMYGEFGRTPKINKDNGRDHWGACQSAILAGGGIQGGQVYGSSDRDSAYPTSDPVTPEDMLATIYYALGIAPESEIRDALGRPHRIVNGQALTGLFS